MLNFLQMYQVYILIGCGIFCAFLAASVALMRFQSLRKKRVLIRIEIGVAILMIADAISYIYRGDTSSLGKVMLRISAFLVYFFLTANIFSLNSYITTLIMEQGRHKKLPVPLLLGFILPAIQISLIIATQFTGWFYSFDAQNQFVRGPLFFASYIIPFTVMVVQFVCVIVQRKLIQKRLRVAIILFSILPPTAGILQYHFDGVSYINFSIWAAATALFWFALVNQNEELSAAATREYTSGLPNAYGYVYEVDRISHYGNLTDYNAYYFDIVRMGLVDRRYGKEKADEIIVRYAHTIKASLDRDEILGRLGGNYFVALIKKIHTEQFLALLADTPVEFEFEGKKEQLHMSAVAGIYEINHKNTPPGKLLACTSSAVTYAKNVAHQPYVFLDAELEEKLSRQRHMEGRVRRALQNGEFEVYYQPKVNTDTRMLVGSEALVRWKHQGKFILPEEFIPIIENNGYICDLDFYMLEHVCKDLKTWMQEGVDLVCVSVNFSRKNLGNPKFTRQIHEVVKKYEIPEQYIQIEITETVDGYSLECLKNVVEELQDVGIRVAIDDFGTGSSSIRLLKEIPFDVMKIDKAFVDYNDDKTELLLTNMIRMAEGVGIEVIAEGVRTQEQIESLAQKGCTLVQGYVFDEPLEKTVYAERLKCKQYE